MMSYWVLFGSIFLLSILVSTRFKGKFKKYSQLSLRSGLSGREIAEKMLQDNGISDVKVISVQGQLSDHYNPIDKTVNLSPEVYAGRSVAAAAVAAHECGHAVQHATAYHWLSFRSAMVPMLNITSRWMQWVLLGGILLMGTFGPTLLWAGIALFTFTTIFSFITLPVEFDASSRALAWLDHSGILVSQEHENAKDALKWAAMTYVVAAISSLATLAYYVMIALGRRN